MRPYQTSDYDQICKWCAMRDISPPPEWALPEDGFIVENIAVGFLILMNNKMAQIDFYISNPFSEKIFRSRSLDKITQKLIETAKSKDVQVILCTTKNQSVRDRALRHEFSEDGHFMAFRKGL